MKPCTDNSTSQINALLHFIPSTKSFINYTAVSTWKMYNTFKPSQLSLDRSLLIPLCVESKWKIRNGNQISSFRMTWSSYRNSIFIGGFSLVDDSKEIFNRIVDFYELKYCHPLSIDLCMFQWYPCRPTNCTHYVGNCKLYVENVVTRCIIYPRFKICFL